MKEISNKTRSGIIQNTYKTHRVAVGVGKTSYTRIGNTGMEWWLPYEKEIIGPKALTVWSS